MAFWRLEFSRRNIRFYGPVRTYVLEWARKERTNW